MASPSYAASPLGGNSCGSPDVKSGRAVLFQMNKTAEPLKIEYRPLESLIPYANNSRTHSGEQIAQIAASIKEWGFTNPILVDGENGIIAGHGRVLAARKLAMGTVPVIELSHMSDAQKRAYIIADNKLAEKAGWDADLLRIEFAELNELGFDLSLTGFDVTEMGDILGDVGQIDDVEIPEAKEKEEQEIVCPKCGCCFAIK
jgi:ParB-like chromosome segregation protein Spo0J